jgi:ABC-2 type transport system permease protein
VKLVLAHARAKVVELARYPSFVVPTLGFPAAFFLAFGASADSGDADLVVASFLAFAILGVAFFVFGVGLANERDSPWEVFLRILPVATSARLAARLLATLPYSLVSGAAVVLAAALTTPADLSVEQWLRLTGVLLLGIVPFGLLGTAVGYWSTPRGALPLANGLYLVLAYAGGLWIAPDHLPDLVASLSPYLPTRHWADLLWDSVGGPPSHTGDWLGLAAYTTLFGALAARGFRRDEGRRYR